MLERASLLAVAKKEPPSGIFQRPLAEDHSGLIYRVAVGFSFPHLEELSNSLSQVSPKFGGGWLQRV